MDQLSFGDRGRGSTPIHLQKEIGNLARKSWLSDPHTPVWVSGLNYPVQYMVRETRSMSSAKSSCSFRNEEKEQFIVSIPLKGLRCCAQRRMAETSLFPPVSQLSAQCLKPLDFFLPDEIFQMEKLEKLKEVEMRKLKNAESVLGSPSASWLMELDSTSEDASTITHNEVGGASFITCSSSSPVVSKLCDKTVVKQCNMRPLLKRGWRANSLSTDNVKHRLSSACSNNTIVAGISSGFTGMTSSISHNDRMGYTCPEHPLVNGFIYDHCIQVPGVNNNNNNNNTKNIIRTWRAASTERGTVIACISHSWVRLYHELELIYSLGNHEELLSLDLVHTSTNNGHLFLGLGYTHQRSFWSFSLDQPPLEMFIDPVDRKYSNIQGWQEHAQAVISQDNRKDGVVISFLSECSVRTAHLSMSHNKWGVVCREILPQSDRVQSISSVGRGGSLLVGVANMNLLLWDVSSSSVLCSFLPLTCRPPPGGFPQIQLMRLFKGPVELDNKFTVFVLLCVTGSSPLDQPVAWLVAMDTNSDECTCVMRYYRPPPTGISSNSSILDFCCHGNQFTLLFSNGYLTSWSLFDPRPVMSVSIESPAAAAGTSRYHTLYRCESVLLLGELSVPATDYQSHPAGTINTTVHLLRTIPTQLADIIKQI